MQVFRLKLFTSTTGEYHKGDKDYCLKNNLAAIGWAIDKNVDSVDDFINKARKQYKNQRGFNTASKHIIEMQVGDFCWVQVNAYDYRLGKIKSDILYHQDPNNSRIGLRRKCIWKKIDFNDIPGKVISCFCGRTGTLQKINKISYDYCNWLYENKQNNLKIQDVKSLLHYDDLEDILGLYLQNKGYYILPSTNKQSTKLIEYELRDKKGNKACVQCKIGNSTVDNKLFNEEKFKDYTIFISTISDDNYNIKGENVKTIKINKLLSFAKTHFNILPERIKNYIKLSE